MEKLASHKGIGTIIRLKEVEEDLIIVADRVETIKLVIKRLGLDPECPSIKFKPAIVSSAP